MDNSEKKAAPPLWIWLIFLTIALFAIAVLLHFFAVKNKNDFKERTYYLQNKIKNAGENPLVVIVGSSLTRCAFDSSNTIENFIRNRTGTKPVIAKIWRSATNLETIIDHMSVLKNIHPDILVVEANMLCYSAEQQSLINEIPSLLYNITNQKINNPYLAEEKPQKRLDTGLIKTRTGLIDTTQLHSFKELALLLAKQGTRIILVNIPLEASEEVKKWSSADTMIFKRNFNYIQKEVSFIYWNPIQYWDMSYYFNKGHLNMKGCKAFTKWFSGKLSEQVNKL